MMETGDWVTPRSLYGTPWFAKPAAVYWRLRFASTLFGVSETAARVLPSAISDVFATLELAWLALADFTARKRLAGCCFCLPTTVGMIGFSHALARKSFQRDAHDCHGLRRRVLGLTRNENTPISLKHPGSRSFLFGLLPGLAVLAKGHAAIILAGGAFFSGRSSPNAGATLSASLIPQQSRPSAITALPW